MVDFGISCLELLDSVTRVNYGVNVWTTFGSPVVNVCEHNYKSAGSIEEGYFYDQLNNYKVLKECVSTLELVIKQTI